MAGTKTSTTSDRQHPGSVSKPKELDLTVQPKPLDATKPDPVLDAVDRTAKPGLLEAFTEALGLDASEEPFIRSEPIIGETPKDKPTAKTFNNTTAGIGVNGSGKVYGHITGGDLVGGMGGGLRLTEDGRLQGEYIKGKAIEAIDIIDLAPEPKHGGDGFDDVYGGQFDKGSDPAPGEDGSKGAAAKGDGDPGGFDRPTEARERPSDPEKPSGGDSGGSTGDVGGSTGGGSSTGGSDDGASGSSGSSESGGTGSSGSSSSGSSGSSGSSESGSTGGSSESGDSGDSEKSEGSDSGGKTGDTPEPGGPPQMDPDDVFQYGGPRPNKSDPGPDQEPSVEVDFQPEWWKGTEMERHDESWLQSNLDLPNQIVSNPDPNSDPTGATTAGRARPIPADPVEVGATNEEVREQGEALLGRGEKGIRPEVSRPADDTPPPPEETEEQPIVPRKPLPI